MSEATDALTALKQQRQLGWCATHDDIGWEFPDGSFGCFVDAVASDAGWDAHLHPPCEVAPEGRRALLDVLQPTPEELGGERVDSVTIVVELQRWQRLGELVRFPLTHEERTAI